MQTAIDFTIHNRERTRESETILNNNRKSLEGNCKTLMQYWCRNNIWLSDDNSRKWLDVKCLAQRVADLKHVNQVPIEDRIVNGRYKEYRIKCTCRIVSGSDVTDGCYLHDEKLKIK